MRLDLYLAQKHPERSRSVWQKLIRDGRVRVDRIIVKQPRTEVGDDATVEFDEKSSQIETMDLPVIYEDENVVVIDKPVGVLTHSKGALDEEFTVADFIKLKIPKQVRDDKPQNIHDSHVTTYETTYDSHNQARHSGKTAISKTTYDSHNGDKYDSHTQAQNIHDSHVYSDNRFGIVHRLDRATSGVIIGAKNAATKTLLQKQFQDRKAKKTYLAVVDVTAKGRKTLEQNGDEFTIDLPIARNPKIPSQFKVDAKGKAAITGVKVVETTSTKALLELRPKTGRTHQLRVHLAYVGLPIVNDSIYGKNILEHKNPFYKDGPCKDEMSRMMLHAKELEITVPDGQRKTFKAEVPRGFRLS
jgi:RluA family pseudouridine synthase